MPIFFNSINGQKLFSRHLEKTTVPFISARNLAGMDIPVPSKAKQIALIDFEKANREYARLSNRKLQLQKLILSYELTKEERSSERKNR